jgi:tetratricopeptide (TPR) repeat protein
LGLWPFFIPGSGVPEGHPAGTVAWMERRQQRPSPIARPGGRGEPARPPRDLRWIAGEIRLTARAGLADRVLAALDHAVAMLEKELFDEAVERSEEAKRLAPRSGAVREILGMALYGAGRYRDALRELQAYRRITGRVDQNHLIADSHRAMAAPAKAVEPIREALRAGLPDEVRAEATVVGASALADLGRYEEALGILRAYPSGAAARPFDLRVWYVAGDILERAGRQREAAEEFRKILSYDPSAFDARDRLARLG